MREKPEGLEVNSPKKLVLPTKIKLRLLKVFFEECGDNDYETRFGRIKEWTVSPEPSVKSILP